MASVSPPPPPQSNILPALTHGAKTRSQKDVGVLRTSFGEGHGGRTIIKYAGGDTDLLGLQCALCVFSDLDLRLD